MYDGHVHGSWKMIRDRTNAKVGRVASAGEQHWLKAYVDQRRTWLATNSRADLRALWPRIKHFD